MRHFSYSLVVFIRQYTHTHSSYSSIEAAVKLT